MECVIGFISDAASGGILRIRQLTLFNSRKEE